MARWVTGSPQPRRVGWVTAYTPATKIAPTQPVRLKLPKRISEEPDNLPKKAVSKRPQISLRRHEEMGRAVPRPIETENPSHGT